MSGLARDAWAASMVSSSNVALETRSSDLALDVNFHFTSLHLAHTTATMYFASTSRFDVSFIDVEKKRY